MYNNHYYASLALTLKLVEKLLIQNLIIRNNSYIRKYKLDYSVSKVRGYF